MARIKLAYIGGGSTRAPGTMASFIHQGENFQGSEVVLIDVDGSHLQLVKTLADKMARSSGIDLTISCTTDRRAGLQDCDAVLTSFRPGGFEACYLDEAIPLRHGVIGQETQGPSDECTVAHPAVGCAQCRRSCHGNAAQRDSSQRSRLRCFH